MIVVLDASTFVSAALKANSIPERALLCAVDKPNRLILSQEVEDEYREVIFRPKFDRFVSVERRQKILDIVIFAAERVAPNEAVRECRDPADDKYLALALAGRADPCGLSCPPVTLPGLARRETPLLGRCAQRDRAEKSPAGQVDDDEPAIAVREHEVDDQAIAARAHGLDSRACRQLDRGSGKGLQGRPRPAPRQPAGDHDHKGCDPGEDHHPHDDDQDLQRAHRLNSAAANVASLGRGVARPSRRPPSS